MTISYLLAPIPKWVILDNDGKPAAGAQLATRSSLDPTSNKAVYEDPAGTIPYTNPVIFDANGTQGPFYWKVDSANPDDLYFLEAKDSDGNLLWTIQNYSPPGEGGGGSATTYLPLKNLISNNVFLNHIDDIGSLTNITNQVICPSNHINFTPDISPIIGNRGALGPDIRFVKENTSTASDRITFEKFNLGSNDLTNDVTPVEYIRYRCSGAPSEGYKSFQFPICSKVQNLEDTTVTATLWAKSNTTAQTINWFTRQYFGSEGGSNEVYIQAGVSMNLTNSWTKFNVQFNVPNVATKTLGDCGDDALYLNLGMPLGVDCDISFIKPSLYLGSVGSTADFDTYDQIDSITETPRTADTVSSMSARARQGWVLADDRTIGSASSGATNRANIDTFFLYKTLWDSVPDLYAPVTTGRGASAQADFKANKSLRLTRALGRVMAGANQATISQSFTIDNTGLATVSSTATLPTGTPVIVSGGSLPSQLSANAVYYVINVNATTFKLALSVDYAEAGTPIIVTSAGSGTIQSALGAAIGEGLHTLTIAEMPAHNHPGSTQNRETGTLGGANSINSNSSLNVSTTIGNINVASQGGGQAHNTMQPTVFPNVFFKL